MEKCKDRLQREFYLRMTRKFGWTKNVLIHQIENQTYEKTLHGQTNFGHTVPDNIRIPAKLAVRDEEPSAHAGADRRSTGGDLSL